MTDNDERVPSGRNDEVEGHLDAGTERASSPERAYSPERASSPERAGLVEDDGPEVEGHRFGHSPTERVMTDPNRAS
jgi:hypothetical protein